VASLVVSGAAPGLRGVPFTLALIAIAVAIFAFGRWLDSSYAFFIGYVVVQYIVLGTAWNILGGYTGYVNFGITAFFAIGGADGLGEAIRQPADLTLAFGPGTWPHQLVRIMLLEQIYRAFTILTGHPYHRE